MKTLKNALWALAGIIAITTLAPLFYDVVTQQDVSVLIAQLKGFGYNVWAAPAGDVTFTGNLLPDVADSNDIGSAAAEWQDVYVGSTGKVYLGTDQARYIDATHPATRTATLVVAGDNAPAWVKAQADYVCDGTADNVEIQAALDALTAARTVKESVKLIGNFTITAKINLPSYTILDLYDASIALVNAGAVSMLEASSKTEVEIRGGVLNGNKANVTGAFDVLDLTNTSKITLVDLEVKNSARKGIDGYGCSDVFLNNVYVHDNGEAATPSGYGCVFNTDAKRIRIFYSRFIDNSHHGLWISDNHANAGHEPQDIIISGCYAEGNGADGTGSGIYVHENTAGRTASDGTVVNCVSRANTNDGILFIRVTDGTIAGNVSNDNTADGIVIDTCDGVTVSGNTANDNTAKGIYCLDTDGILGANIVIGNTTSGNTNNIVPTGTDEIVVMNRGYVTSNSGTATVLNTTTSIVVNHGLATTPTRVQITPTENPTNAVSFWWVDTLTATQFTIHVNADPGASNLDFDWRAVIGEGN